MNAPIRRPGWPAGGGEMGARIGAHDWRTTALGPIERWPHTLKAAVDLVLRTPVPMAIGWGAPGVCLYNDAFAAIAAARHPALLGSRLADHWPELAGLMARILEAAHADEALAPGDRTVMAGCEDPSGRPCLEFACSPIVDEHGGPAGLLVVVSDTSAATQARAALLESEARFRQFGENSADVLWIADAETRRLEYLSPAFETVWGEPAERVLKDLGRWAELVHPDDRAHAARGMPELLAGRRSNIEYRIVRPSDGAIRWIRDAGFPILDATGRVRRVAGIAQDLTDRHRAEAALRESEERLRLAVQSSSLGWWDMDARSSQVFWSANARRMFGLSDEHDITLEAAVARMHPGDAARVREAIVAAMRPDSDGGYHQQYRVVWGDGTVHWIEALGQVHFEHRDGVRRASRFSGVLTDVTEQQDTMQALAESEQRFRLITDTMPQIVWTTRPDGYHDYFNERWYEYTGMPRPHEPGGEYDPEGTGQGWNWKDYLHPDDYQGTLETWSACLASGSPYRVEYRFKRRDGQYRWFDGRALPLRNDAGEIVRWFGTLTDIHDQKLAAQERTALIEQLREADRRKDEFLALLAHELRNPLAPLTNAHRLLARSAGLTETDRKVVAMIQRQTGQLKRLIDDLLDASRITRGLIGLRPEAVTLNDAVCQAAETVAHEFGRRGHTLLLDLPADPVVIRADSARLAQVLENLLVNACKYTPEGGRVDVKVEPGPDDVEIRVTDNGIGIAPDKLERVFELFVQAQPGVGEHQGGLGIGLAMVRRLVEMHGGRVHAESEGLGKGATFVVRLPRGA